MKKRVSASTITGITSSPAFADTSVIPPVPTVDELIAQMRDTLKSQAEDAKKLQMAANGADRGSLAKSFNRSVTQLVDIDRIVADVPAGFKLVPVYYSRISQAQNEIVHNEYSFHVRPSFLKFVANNHADDLRKLGICEHGIARMKKGLDAADSSGEMYDLSIDHIIERSGGGYFSTTKTKDVLNPNEPARFPVNHFGNFILLPEKIHRFKNELNAIQKIADVGDGKWMLMMIPDRNDQQAGFVCPPQDPSHPLAGVDKRPMDIFRKISHTAFLVTQVKTSVRELCQNPLVAGTVTTFAEIARLKGKRVIDIANDNTLAGPAGQLLSLKNIFNQSISYDKTAEANINGALRPSLTEATELIKGSFGEVSGRVRAGKDKGAYKAFDQFLNSGNLAKLCNEISDLPMDEARIFVDECARLSKEMKTLHGILVSQSQQQNPPKPKTPEQAHNNNQSRNNQSQAHNSFHKKRRLKAAAAKKAANK